MKNDLMHIILFQISKSFYLFDIIKTLLNICKFNLQPMHNIISLQKISKILTVLSLLILTLKTASTPLIYVRDNYIASYPVGLTFTGGFGIGNNTATFPHAPDITPTSMNYKLLISTSYNADYTISNNTISIAVQVSTKNQTHISTTLYTSYVQAFNGVYIYIEIFVIDQASPSYSYILPSILRLNNLTLMSTSYDQLIDVFTFSPKNLNLRNNLAIYSFITGFQIVSQNRDFQLTVNSQIINESIIKVIISSQVNLVSVDLVRIDTVVIDITEITFSKLLALDFQTVDCPTDPYIINYAYPSYLLNIQNIFTGLSQFYLINKDHYAFRLTANPTNIGITVFAAYNFSRIVFTNLFFAMKQCPIGFPFFNKPSQLCFSTSCSEGYYQVVIPQQCLPCFYACKTCDNGNNCTSCNSTADFRRLDAESSLCVPIDGYYDDGTNNSVAQMCNFPCGNCSENADKCTSCINITFFLDNATSICQMCNNSIQRCIKCLSRTRCTVCSPYFNLFNSTNATICQQICGDGVLFNLECDDGNLINGDGCSSTCYIEQFYACSGGSSTSQSVCVYNGNIEITTISFLKDETKNTIYLRFQINKNINISSINLNEMFLPNFPYQNIQTIYDASLDQYLCTINYDKPLNSYDRLTLTFRFPTNSNFSSSLNFTIALNSQTDNNLALKVYSSHMYSQLQSLTDSSEILIYLYAAVCLLSWIAGKQLYSLELFFIIQYAYLGLLTIDRLEFSMISLKQFGLTFGLIDMNNLMKSSNQFSISSNNPLPIKIKSLGFSESLLFNINFSFVALLSMFFVGLLIYFIGIKLSQTRWQIQGKKMFFWWVFYWLIIIQIPVMTSICISFKYQNVSFQNFGVDLSISLLYMIFFVGVAIYLVIYKIKTQQIKVKNLNKQNQKEISAQMKIQKSIHQSKYTLAQQLEFYLPKLKVEEKTQNNSVYCFLRNFFYLFVMVYRVLLVLIVLLFSDSTKVNEVCLILNVLILLYISVIRPYQFNFRPIFNSSIILILSVFYTYENIISKQSNVSFSSFNAVTIIMALLYLTLVVNAYFILKEIIQKLVICIQQSIQKIETPIENKKINQTLQDLIQEKEFKRNNQKQSKANIQFKQENNSGALKFQTDEKDVKFQQQYQRKKRRDSSVVTFIDESGQNNGQAIQISSAMKMSYNNQQNRGFSNKNNLKESQSDIDSQDLYQKGVVTLPYKLQKVQINSNIFQSENQIPQIKRRGTKRPSKIKKSKKDLIKQ